VTEAAKALRVRKKAVSEKVRDSDSVVRVARSVRRAECSDSRASSSERASAS